MEVPYQPQVLDPNYERGMPQSLVGAIETTALL